MPQNCSFSPQFFQFTAMGVLLDSFVRKKEAIVNACFSQNAAKTAKEIVVAVSRIDT